jgi:ribA/ribD-fused uncharacterized protein
MDAITTPPAQLYFYDAKAEFGFLSNFYSKAEFKGFTLDIGGKQWKTVEHYYQAAKFMQSDDTNVDGQEVYVEQIRTASTPGMAKILANQKVGGGYPWRLKLNEFITQSLEAGVTIRSDWETVKDQIMYQALVAKFTQNPGLLQLLIATAQLCDELVEHTTRDAYWGDGKNGTGKNMLGKLLTQIRNEHIPISFRNCTAMGSEGSCPSSTLVCINPKVSHC